MCCCSLRLSSNPQPSPNHWHADFGNYHDLAGLGLRGHIPPWLCYCSASATCSSPYSTLVWRLSHVHCTRLLAVWTIPVPGNCVSFIPGNLGMENVGDSQVPGKWEPRNANPSSNSYVKMTFPDFSRTFPRLS